VQQEKTLPGGGTSSSGAEKKRSAETQPNEPRYRQRRRFLLVLRCDMPGNGWATSPHTPNQNVSG